jgi:hypothetical protein
LLRNADVEGMRTRSIIITLGLVLSACTHKESLKEIGESMIGKTQWQLTERLGRPQDIETSSSGEIWRYYSEQGVGGHTVSHGGMTFGGSEVLNCTQRYHLKAGLVVSVDLEGKGCKKRLPAYHYGSGPTDEKEPPVQHGHPSES